MKSPRGFLAEIETTANLKHPHVLPLFDSGETHSFLFYFFYAMPFATGETLGGRIDRGRQLAVEQALGTLPAKSIRRSVCCEKV